MPTRPATVTSQSRNRKTLRSWLVLAVLLAALALAYGHMQAVSDWFRLYGYTPSAAVSGLASDDTFTPAAQHLYDINRPAIMPKNQFTTKCANHQEQTIVLGCYHGYQQGIYILQIASDSRLQGVEQVTAAHEMLHAAYDRLSASDRKQVDAMLLDYYDHHLTDERIRQTIAAYKQSEPDAVVNEMHSVFGTEIAQLPAPLEQYYQRYFTDRQKIAGYAAGYQAEFTSRQQQVAADDARLATLKKTIAANEATLKAQAVDLNARAGQMSRLKASGQTGAYNAQVDSFNAAVDGYNRLVATTKAQIADYNQLVQERNAVALEQKQLTDELSGRDVSTIPNR
jgi:hypothetical protein